jgi:hypothetical protein
MNEVLYLNREMVWTQLCPVLSSVIDTILAFLLLGWYDFFFGNSDWNYHGDKIMHATMLDSMPLHMRADTQSYIKNKS